MVITVDFWASKMEKLLGDFSDYVALQHAAKVGSFFHPPACPTSSIPGSLVLSDLGAQHHDVSASSRDHAQGVRLPKQPADVSGRSPRAVLQIERLEPPSAGRGNLCPISRIGGSPQVFTYTNDDGTSATRYYSGSDTILLSVDTALRRAWTAAERAPLPHRPDQHRNAAPLPPNNASRNIFQLRPTCFRSSWIRRWMAKRISDGDVQ